jgi:hypothetical protein
MSIPLVYAALIFVICGSLVYRAKSQAAIDAGEASTVYGLFVALLIWVGAVSILGIRGVHVSLMEEIPLLWQAFVPMVIWMSAFAFSAPFRRALWKIAKATPAHWLVLIQALRIGAIGGVMKGLRGEIASSYVFWIGIPDLLFGLSALAVAWSVQRQWMGGRALIAWNLVGFSLIVFPTFLPMNYWMNEPGFEFIFEFPMVLAPSIVVSLLISLNLFQAWTMWRQRTLAQVVS